jgi:hypothetical protein
MWHTRHKVIHRKVGTRGAGPARWVVNYFLSKEQALVTAPRLHSLPPDGLGSQGHPVEAQV